MRIFMIDYLWPGHKTVSKTKKKRDEICIDGKASHTGRFICSLNSTTQLNQHQIYDQFRHASRALLNSSGTAFECLQLLFIISFFKNQQMAWIDPPFIIYDNKILIGSTKMWYKVIYKMNDSTCVIQMRFPCLKSITLYCLCFDY